MSKNVSAIVKATQIGLSARKLNDQTVQVYSTPRVGDIADNEIKIRIIKRNNDVLIHVTAPDAASLEKAVQKIFPDEKDLLIEFCG